MVIVLKIFFVNFSGPFAGDQNENEQRAINIPGKTFKQFEKAQKAARDYTSAITWHHQKSLPKAICLSQNCYFHKSSLLEINYVDFLKLFTNLSRSLLIKIRRSIWEELKIEHFITTYRTCIGYYNFHARCDVEIGYKGFCCGLVKKYLPQSTSYVIKSLPKRVQKRKSRNLGTRSLNS